MKKLLVFDKKLPLNLIEFLSIFLYNGIFGDFFSKGLFSLKKTLNFRIFPLENRLIKTKWPLISIESLVKGLDKLSFSLNNEELANLAENSDNLLNLKVDFNKAFHVSLRKYSRELQRKFLKEAPFI